MVFVEENFMKFFDLNENNDHHKNTTEPPRPPHLFGIDWIEKMIHSLNSELQSEVILFSFFGVGE